MPDEKQPWVDEVELPDAVVKWGFSHFDGRADIYNEEGDHNFVLVLPEQTAREMREVGWNVKEKEAYEEGDPPEWHLDVSISFKFRDPLIYFIMNSKNGPRKMRATEADLADIRRDTCARLDVILTPYRWVNRERTGIKAYVKEMYVTIKQSRFALDYADLEEIR